MLGWFVDSLRRGGNGRAKDEMECLGSAGFDEFVLHAGCG